MTKSKLHRHRLLDSLLTIGSSCLCIAVLASCSSSADDRSAGTAVPSVAATSFGAGDEAADRASALADTTAAGGDAGGPAPSWVVVLAGASTPNDELLATAAADAERLGYPGAATTNCDRGAAEALGMSPDGSYTVSLYFDSEAEAADAQRQLEESGVPGVVAVVRQICPD